ncbi:MAG: hypothetical protein ACR2QR_02940, partial [Woeseiaceae bacterium]
AIMLALKKKIAIPLFAASLAAIVIQMGYVFFVMNASEILEAGAMILPFMVIGLGALQLWFAIHVKGRGWIG